MILLSLSALILSAEVPFERAQIRCQAGDLSSCLTVGRYQADNHGPHRDEARAAGLFQTLCSKNEADACHELGVLYASGRGVAKDLTKALQLWDKGCARTSRGACYALGIAYLEGQGSPVRLVDAERLLSGACARDYVPACLRLSRYLMVDAQPAARDATRGLWLLSQACQAGDVPSCLKACEARLHGDGIPRMEAEALPDCQRACDGKALAGCWGVAQLNLHSNLPSMSARQAVSVLTTACQGAEARSCITLGELAAVGGAGMRKSPGLAKDRFQFAHLRLDSLCGKDTPTECVLDHELLAQGRVKDPNPPATRKALAERCAAPQLQGCFGLGVALARGHGGAVDAQGALAAFRRGCEAGQPRACRAAGQAVAAGKGAPADVEEGKRLLTLACEGWDAEGCAALAELSGGKKTSEGKLLRQRACRQGYGPACR